MIPAISVFASNSPILTNLTVNCSNPNNVSNSQRCLTQTLKSLTKSGELESAIRLIESSPSDLSNSQVYSTVLHACISTKSVQHGRRLYSLLLQKKDLLRDPELQSKLITLFSACGHVDLARCVFDDAVEFGDVAESVWVAMSIGYAKNGFFREALLVYVEMLCCSEEPGNFAFSGALKACTELKCLSIGRGVHAQIVKSSEEVDQVVRNVLLQFYARAGRLEDALKVFDEMPVKNVVSWNSMISSFVEQDLVFESLNTFRKMQKEGFEFSWVTLTTILSACSRVTALHSGKEIHAQTMKSRRKPDVPLLNSLMDMYGKCGEVAYSKRVFDLMRIKDLTSWNTVLNGYAINGRMKEAMQLFSEMIESGIKPDGVTFIALLSGYSDTGLTDEGQRLFKRMKNEFGISPRLEHYACLVDLLGRAGRISEALEIVENMPCEPNGSIWGSLLNSCRLHANVSIGERVANKLFDIEPDNPGNYVILSNIYADAGMWDDVTRIREIMKQKGVRKEVGCSWIQIKNKIHTFVASGGFEFRNSPEYDEGLAKLKEDMEEIGYVPDTGVVLHDVDEETKVNWVCGHSEKLATVYALIHTTNGQPIRIAKNLRVCADCHSWMKAITRVTGRVIVLRDTNHFHHFKEGSCSCKDYW